MERHGTCPGNQPLKAPSPRQLPLLPARSPWSSPTSLSARKLHKFLKAGKWCHDPAHHPVRPHPRCPIPSSLTTDPEPHPDPERHSPHCTVQSAAGCPGGHGARLRPRPPVGSQPSVWDHPPHLSHDAVGWCLQAPWREAPSSLTCCCSRLPLGPRCEARPTPFSLLGTCQSVPSYPGPGGAAGLELAFISCFSLLSSR